MAMAGDGMMCSRAPQIVYSSAVLIPVSPSAPLRTVPRSRRRAVPDQEFPRPSARSYRPDRDDEDPPPWANLPPVRSTRPRHLAGAANPPGPGRPADDTRPGPDPRQDEPVPSWAQWDEPETDGDPDIPPAQPRGPGGRALRAA